MIYSQTEPVQEASGKPLKGWHVLLIMLGFFGVMFAVNGVFLYHAITSFPGEDIKKSYVQGLNYNDTLAERAAYADLGWTAEAGLRDDALVFRLNDADGAPLSNYGVIGELRRATTRAADQAIVFDAHANGEYVFESAALEAGQWSLRVFVMDPAAEEKLFEVHKTILVK